MMLIDAGQPPAVRYVTGLPATRVRRRVEPRPAPYRRPAGAAPHGRALRYRPIVPMGPRGCIAPRRVSVRTTIWLAVLAGATTLWLGLIADLGAAVAGAGQDSRAPIPDQLAVVRVDAGESLAELARRVAPDAPAGRVAERIRELNHLDSAGLQAGQVLLAPVR